MMFRCVTCDKPLSECVCPDLDERLKRMAFNPQGQVMFKWCRKCDKHYARCKCVPPEFYVLCAGKEVDPNTIQNIVGQRVVPDLTER